MLIALIVAGACITLSHRQIPENCGDADSTLLVESRSTLGRHGLFFVNSNRDITGMKIDLEAPQAHGLPIERDS
jgi:hypothetical protein